MPISYFFAVLLKFSIVWFENLKVKNMKLEIRNTTVQDFRITEDITREAFWDVYKPGCDEHLVLHQLRGSPDYVKGLDFAAIVDNRIIGHIISSKARIIDANGKESEVLCVGPLCVLPEFQHQGIGSELMQRSISTARNMGFSAMILFGNPDYYHRFGFKNAAQYRITTKDNQNFEPFMALEIQDGGLSKVTGKFYEDKAFEINSEALEEFEKDFPYREKHVTGTQLKEK